MVTHHKTRIVVYAIAATLGSVAGCLVHALHRTKGRRRAGREALHHEEHRAREGRVPAPRHDGGADSVAAPARRRRSRSSCCSPASRRSTSAASRSRVALGRGVRYFALGFLAIEYGDRALAYMHENGITVSLNRRRPPVRRLAGTSSAMAERGKRITAQLRLAEADS